MVSTVHGARERGGVGSSTRERGLGQGDTEGGMSQGPSCSRINYVDNIAWVKCACTTSQKELPVEGLKCAYSCVFSCSCSFIVLTVSFRHAKWHASSNVLG